jgi:hypothetical protein
VVDERVVGELCHGWGADCDEQWPLSGRVGAERAPGGCGPLQGTGFSVPISRAVPGQVMDRLTKESYCKKARRIAPIKARIKRDFPP